MRDQRGAERGRRMRMFSEKSSFPFRHCVLHPSSVSLLCGSEGDETQARTEWIINVKICFSTEVNKLSMIRLSERLLAWIRKANGSRGAGNSPRVIDSWMLLTVGSLWLRKPGPEWSPESGSLGGGGSSQAFQGHPCPERGAVDNPRLRLLWNTDLCIDMKPWTQISAHWAGVGGFPVSDTDPLSCTSHEDDCEKCCFVLCLKQFPPWQLIRNSDGDQRDVHHYGDTWSLGRVILGLDFTGLWQCSHQGYRLPTVFVAWRTYIVTADVLVKDTGPPSLFVKHTSTAMDKLDFHCEFW